METTIFNPHASRQQGLYDHTNEHDSCGVGFIANIEGISSHTVIEYGIEILKNLLHRGAIGGDSNTGDGAGILIQIPDKFLRRECFKSGFQLPQTGEYAVGMVFLPAPQGIQKRCMQILEQTIQEEGCLLQGWREVPVNPDVLGAKARAEMPRIMQCFLAPGPDNHRPFEICLYLIRKQAERRCRKICGTANRFCIISLSSRTLIYKGLMMAPQIPEFYPELTSPDMVSALAVVHQRYSTNTFPSWHLAQPFHYLAHNGEINTLRGNLSQMRAREKLLQSDLLGNDIKKILPVIDPDGSDSACLDNALELLVLCGRSLPHAMMMLIPEAWGMKYHMGPDQRGFLEYHAGLMEPWDGPAAVVFSDGRQVGAMLDRNGLRPARYLITNNGFIVMASEAGVLDFPASSILEKGAMRPGQILLADLQQKRIIKNGEIKTYYSRRRPYRRWVQENHITLHGFFDAVAPVNPDLSSLLFRQRLFGYTRECLRLILEPMASKGYEPIGSMGFDAPLAVFSEQPQLLYSYFKQLFAQVTNPAIDPIREEMVMSLMTFIGNSPNILTEIPQHSRLIKLRHPVLSNEDLERIRTLNVKGFETHRLGIGFPAGGSGQSLAAALEELCAQAEAAVAEKKYLLILSDRQLPATEIPMPALLAVSAVNQHLINRGVRTRTGLILETGEARETMHLALLLGYGATAVNPYLAFETIAALALKGDLTAPISVVSAIENYIHALCKGLLKIMSKVGISTLRSYRSAQVFEAVGIGQSVIEKYFTGTTSRIGGIGLDEIAAEANARHQMAQAPDGTHPKLLSSGGRYGYRVDGERHLWFPDAICKLQQATRTNDHALYREYAALINDQSKKQFTLRGTFVLKPDNPIPIDAVEPASAIIRRFVTGAMSFGSISKEAHETIAIAMNRLGAMSNSGEGGEDKRRYRPTSKAENSCSAIKQVASGRFGVTVEYLVNCRDIQIKIAQGAKPGEGGQLPGHKVNREIAEVRHSTPGVTLISPPPHHDIYSIEDLAQLIYDLKNVNPDARISVKLVSELGVGTIAAGVAKAKADVVLISGYDGGTGASPLSSIQYAGMPWEIGLAETQQTLMLNDLRRSIRIQVDGQLKTGRDVIIAALLGAEEFGFATAALVVCGCVMMRKCHNNTCPAGVATQDPELRKRFTGKPEYLVNFFQMIAEEVREYMAQFGARTMDDLIGRSDLLEMNQAVRFWKTRGLDYSRIFHYTDADKSQGIKRCIAAHDHKLDQALDRQIIPKLQKAIEAGHPLLINLPIRNINRSVGAMLSGHIARHHSLCGLADDTVICNFTGSAGQSFGAFGIKGLTLILEGEANDYLGKGLSGARIIVKAPADSVFDPSRNVIAGNTILYGATAGEVYICGTVCERFAVRNSGAYAVVEGVGDHGCEYMTGGRVVVLGETGLNFAAGMSGGIAYVFDENREFDSCCNLDMVDLELVQNTADIDELKAMIEKHYRYTDSRKAADILANWNTRLPFFVKVFPMEYRRILGQMSHEDEATERQEVQRG